MPYGISATQPDCANWATVKSYDNITETITCHTTKQDAIDQMVALSLAENLEPLGEVRIGGAEEVLIVDIDDTLLQNGVQPIQKVIDYVNSDYAEYLVVIVTGRLESDREATVAALSDAGVQYDRLVMKQDETVDSSEYKKGVAEALIADGKTIDKAIENDADAREAYAELGIEVVDPTEINMADEEMTGVVETNSRSKYDWQIMTDTMQWVATDINEKRSIAYSNLELRAESDGNTIVGYAAIWDSPSEPMPFIEYVKRGAFSKTLNDGADVRLLVDHEGVPLARTKSGTMSLIEDERGLRMEAKLDPMNPDAARIISAMKRGDLSQMSFAFRTVKDNWNNDRSVRELREVQLFDVSVVTFPAYEETVAELRTKNVCVTVPVTTGVLLRKQQIALQKYRSR